jgi:purine-cytosine permease-like protein
MESAIFVSVIGICFFISVVNFYFQKEKYKYSMEEELKNLPVLKSPSTWLISAIVSALIIAGTLFMSMANIVNGLSGVENGQNTINQYQDDLSNQNTNSSQTDNIK